jgi:hypothetical protein
MSVNETPTTLRWANTTTTSNNLRGGSRKGSRKGTRKAKSLKGGAKGNKKNNTRHVRHFPLVGVKTMNGKKGEQYKGLTNNSKNTRGRGPYVNNVVYEGQESRFPIAVNARNVANYKQKIREARQRGEITSQEASLVAKALEGRTPCDAIKYLYETRYQNLSLGAQNLVVGTDRLIQIIEAQFGVRKEDCLGGRNEYVNHNNASSVNVAYYNEEVERNGRPNFSGMYVRGSLNNNNNTSSTRAQNGE